MHSEIEKKNHEQWIKKLSQREREEKNQFPFELLWIVVVVYFLIIHLNMLFLHRMPNESEHNKTHWMAKKLIKQKSFLCLSSHHQKDLILRKKFPLSSRLLFPGKFLWKTNSKTNRKCKLKSIFVSSLFLSFEKFIFSYRDACAHYLYIYLY